MRPIDLTKETPPLTSAFMGPFDIQELAKNREEHNRTSMIYRRPSDKLNIDSHLYIDEEKPSSVVFRYRGERSAE